MLLSNFKKMIGLVTIAVVSSYQEPAARSMTNSDGNMVSKLSHQTGDYNAELYLGTERTEANKGLFTIDTGSASFIVNGNGCQEELCVGPTSDPLKQFKTPPPSEIVYPKLNIEYGDGTGYYFNVYQGPVTIPSGQTVKKANIAYNYALRGDRTDNFNTQGQGIIGLSVPCLSEPTDADTLTESIERDGLGVNSFTTCLNKNEGSVMAWGNELPVGMATADVDFRCAFYSLTYDSFVLKDKDGNIYDTLPAAPLKLAPNNFANTCGNNEATASCVSAPFIDTGTSFWYLSPENYEGLMELMIQFYTIAGKKDAGVNLNAELISILTGFKNDTIDPKRLTEPQKVVMDKTVGDFPMTINVVFKGQGEPKLEANVTRGLLENIIKSKEESDLGQYIINGNIFHFDKENAKLGIEKIGSDGCDKPYFKTISDDPSNAISVSMTSSALSVGIISAVVAAIF